jgi:hypothetical protein
MSGVDTYVQVNKLLIAPPGSDFTWAGNKFVLYLHR